MIGRDSRSLEPAAVMPAYLVSVAGFYVHLIEECWNDYAPAVSRLFAFGWTQRNFVVAAFAMAAVLSLTAVGLQRRSRCAGFIACLFLTSRLAEFLIFVFPFMRPSIEPDNPATISGVVSSGTLVAGMPNYYWKTSGRYYFAGMYTVALAILPALYAMYRMWISGYDVRRRIDEHR